MRLLTWNVHRGEGRRGQENLDDVCRVLRREKERVDVIALQEVPNEEWAEFVAQRLGFTSQTTMPDPNSGVSILYAPHMSRGKTSSFLYAQSCNSTPRGGIEVSFDAPEITVICTHLSAHASMVAQTSEARELAQRVEKIKGDVFVMGDLNSHSVSPALKTLHKSGLRDMWLEARARTRGYFNGCTFPDKFPFQRIDYILCKSDTIISDHANVSSHCTSDHRHLDVKIKT